MTIAERIQSDLREALKRGDALTVEVLRMLRASIHNREIAARQGGAMTDETYQEILRTEAKKRREAAAAFEAGGRAELAEKEKKELAILSAYLPKEMGEADVRGAVGRILADAAGVTFGEAMKLVMAELRGKADARTVSEAVRAHLAKP